MSDLQQNPAFIAWAWTNIVLALNLTILWGLSGGVRAKAGVTPNNEDLSTVSKGAALSGETPEAVSRVLRAHNNALVNITPFLFASLLFVLLGAPGGEAAALFYGFAFFRVLHSVVYVAGKQPWRTLSFALSTLLLLAVVVEDIRYLLM